MSATIEYSGLVPNILIIQKSSESAGRNRERIPAKKPPWLKAIITVHMWVMSAVTLKISNRVLIFSVFVFAIYD